jgi:hypothetical protein
LGWENNDTAGSTLLGRRQAEGSVLLSESLFLKKGDGPSMAVDHGDTEGNSLTDVGVPVRESVPEGLGGELRLKPLDKTGGDGGTLGVGLADLDLGVVHVEKVTR